MNWLIMAEDPKTLRFQNVARTVTLEDALILASAISSTGRDTGRDVQIWFTQRGRLLYSPLSLGWDGFRHAEKIAEAPRKAAEQAKQWKAARKAEKASSEPQKQEVAA